MGVRGSRPPPPPLPRAPRYELLVTIATGGMATVYVGRQHGAAGFERIVAIKRMHPHIANNPELVGAFRDEARIASLIHHPNVVTVQDMHEERGEQLIIMDYVDGVSLRQLRHARHTAGSLVPRNISLRVVVDTLRGLHAAHEQRSIDGLPLEVVHRDATPHNILVGADGCVKITDFGIARAAQRSSATVHGHFKGKFAYMAPEQCTGGAVDRRVDIFTVGVVLWELLTGRHMFSADNDAALVSQISSGRYKRPSEIRRDIPKQIEAIVMNAIAVVPCARFETAAEFADALEKSAADHGGLATAAQVSAVLMATCGEAVLARRHHLQEVLAGRRAKVTWAAPRNAPPSRGSQSYQPQSGADSFDSPLVMPEDSMIPLSSTPSSRKGSQKVVWIAAGCISLCVAVPLAIMWAMRNASSDLPTAANSASASVASIPAPHASPPASSAAQRVSVRIESDQEISEVRTAHGQDVEIQGLTATMSALKSDTPVLVHVQLADGTVMEESVIPRADTVLRLRKTETPKKTPAVATAVAGPPPVVAPVHTATPAPPTAATTAKTTTPRVGPKYETDPYQ